MPMVQGSRDHRRRMKYEWTDTNNSVLNTVVGTDLDQCGREETIGSTGGVYAQDGTLSSDNS